MEFQIVEASRDVLLSEGLAAYLASMGAELMLARATDEHILSALKFIVAWVLTGHDYNQPPTVEERKKLLAFIAGNKIAVEEAFDLTQKPRVVGGQPEHQTWPAGAGPIEGVDYVQADNIDIEQHNLNTDIEDEILNNHNPNRLPSGDLRED